MRPQSAFALASVVLISGSSAPPPALTRASAHHPAVAIDWTCGYEVALAGRLIKGYGATNLRGKRNLAHLIDHLATAGSFATPDARAAAIREAREAALADDAGRGLDQALGRHGVPPRPAVAQPIRWMRKPVAAAAPRDAG